MVSLTVGQPGPARHSLGMAPAAVQCLDLPPLSGFRLSLTCLSPLLSLTQYSLPVGLDVSPDSLSLRLLSLPA